MILKGIPFSEINLLVEFMYKGSVDVQELDLQSLMHTASELEIRGLAYEARDNAAQLLNVNLEYPSYPQTSTSVQPQAFPQARTDVERLKQVRILNLQIKLSFLFTMYRLRLTTGYIGIVSCDN